MKHISILCFSLKIVSMCNGQIFNKNENISKTLYHIKKKLWSRELFREMYFLLFRGQMKLTYHIDIL